MASNHFYSHNGRAGLLRRWVALVIDTLIIAIVVVPIAYALERLISGATYDGAAWVSASGVTMLLYLGYFTLFEARGATPGKKLLGMHVRKRLGGDIGLRESAIRNVMRLIDGFPFVFVPGVPPFYLIGGTAIVVSQHRQRLGDWAADTVVVLTAEEHVPEPVRPHARAARPTATGARRRKK